MEGSQGGSKLVGTGPLLQGSRPAVVALELVEKLGDNLLGMGGCEVGGESLEAEFALNLRDFFDPGLK